MTPLSSTFASSATACQSLSPIDRIRLICKNKVYLGVLADCFVNLYKAGLDCSEELSKIDINRANIFFIHQRNFILLKKINNGISFKFLLSLPLHLLQTLGETGHNIASFVEAGYEFPWDMLSTGDSKFKEALEKLPAFTHLAVIDPNFSWEKLMDNSYPSINYIKEFAELRKEGFEFSLDQFMALNDNKRKIIAKVCNELISCKEANIEISWDQIILMDLYTQGRLKIHANRLKEMQQAGIDPTWDMLIGSRTIRIPP